MHGGDRKRDTIAAAEALLDAGDWEGALAVHRRRLAADPACGETLFALSLALHRLGRLDTAVPLLRRAIALSPGSALLQFNLGQMLSRIGRDDEAVLPYRIAADLAPDWPAPRGALARLAIAAGDLGRGLALGRDMAASDPDQALEIFANAALACAGFRRWPESLALYRELAGFSPPVRAMLGEALAEGRPVPSLARRPAGTPGALPPMAGRFREAYEAGGWDRTRVLVLMPRHINCDPAFIEHDLSHYAVEAARAAGLEVAFIAADDVAYPSCMTPERRLAAPQRLAAIREQILDLRPDVIAIDGNTLADEDTINPDWFLALKAACPFSLVAIVPDSYGHGHDRIRFWSRAVDAFVHFEPNVSAVPGVAANRLLLSPTPVPDYFSPGSDERFIPGLFVGSPTGGATSHRALWLSAMMTHVPDSVALLTNRRADSAPDMTTFAGLHKMARLSVNSGLRADGLMIVTARTYQSIKAGCLLLEHEGSRITDFFTPGEHYAAFSNATDLVRLAAYFLENEDERAAMAENARALMDRHYAAAFFWPYVVRSLRGLAA
ncbi:MAG TPA: glycosyltransferase [Caulobacteraceae bacterium]|nr:glycosyltransferase [Caulobacteraceae bacterium]